MRSKRLSHQLAQTVHERPTSGWLRLRIALLPADRAEHVQEMRALGIEGTGRVVGFRKRLP